MLFCCPLPNSAAISIRASTRHALTARGVNLVATRNRPALVGVTARAVDTYVTVSTFGCRRHPLHRPAAATLDLLRDCPMPVLLEASSSPFHTSSTSKHAQDIDLARRYAAGTASAAALSGGVDELDGTRSTGGTIHEQGLIARSSVAKDHRRCLKHVRERCPARNLLDVGLKDLRLAAQGKTPRQGRAW